MEQVWYPPGQGKFKANCDAAVNVDDGVAMAAMVFRDHQGKILDGDVGRVHEESVLQGEFAAIRLACVLAKEKCFFECIL